MIKKSVCFQIENKGNSTHVKMVFFSNNNLIESSGNIEFLRVRECQTETSHYKTFLFDGLMGPESPI